MLCIQWKGFVKNYSGKRMCTNEYNMPAGLEQPLHKWSGIFNGEVRSLCAKHTCMQSMPKLGGLGACPPENFENALSEIESEGIFTFQTCLHITV